MKISPNDSCWCGSGKKYKKCHMANDDRMALMKSKGFIVPSRELLKTPEQIEGIKRSAAINMACLDAVSKEIKAGMTTADIDHIVHETTISMGGIPAPLNYEGFPRSVCTSLNDEVCHGIPSEDVTLIDGDIINVDCSTILNGYFSDSSRMFMIGEVEDDRKKLVEETRRAMLKGLEQVKPWGRLGDVGAAVNAYARECGYSVVREIGGHGIGLSFHEDPWVGFTTRAGTGMVLVPGLCFTIEPMINAGEAPIFCDEDNGWTIYTEDGSDSAQWEIQVVVTEDGYQVLCW